MTPSQDPQSGPTDAPAPDEAPREAPTAAPAHEPEDDGVSRRASLTGPSPERTPFVGGSLHRWGILGRWFARLFFSAVFFPLQAVETIRKAAERGTVVYVLRQRHTLEFLYFNYAFTVHGLPLARFANGLRFYFWQPVRLFLRSLFRRRLQRDPIDTLRRLTRAHRSSALFLRDSGTIAPSDFDGPYFETLVELQRGSDRPIMLVPLTVFWDYRLETLRPTTSRVGVIDGLIGNYDEPRLFRRIWQVLRHARHSLAAVCEPVDLSEFIADHAEGALTDHQATARVAAALRESLIDRIEAERRVRIGPHRSHFLEIRRRILDRPEIREAMLQRADGAGIGLHRVHRQARRTLDKMQAQLSPRGLARMSTLVQRLLWNRLYDGFEVDEAGIARLQEVGKRGPLVFLPSHRSHVDYLVLSHLLAARDLVPPHVAAGANLSFWPMGWLFRTAGAFFIRRQHHGDELYAALLRAYVAEILHEGHNLEVFIEGGRTRTGRLLPPKLGLLKTIADLTARGELASEVHVVPVSIGYERVLELKSLTRELSGAGKRPEGLRELLRATSVLRAGRNFGYVNVQFAEPIDVAAFMAQRGYDRQTAEPEIRHRAIRSLGYHSVSAAGAVTAITPTHLCAAALCAPGTRGVARETMLRAARIIGLAARTSGARFFGDPPGDDGALSNAAIERAIEFLERDKALRLLGNAQDRVYVSEEEERIRLDYYKNQILHHLVGPSVMAMVLRALARQGAPPFELERANEAARFVTSLFRLHFVNHAGKQFEELSDTSCHRLAELKLLSFVGNDRVELAPAADEPLTLLSGLVESLIESHRATARALLMLRAGPLPRDAAEADVLGQLQRRYLTNQLRRYESCQKPLVKAAIDWLGEEGILVQRQTGGDTELALARDHADGRALEVLIDRTELLLPPPSPS